MKPRLLSCLALGTVLTIILIIFILSTPYSKYLLNHHSSKPLTHMGTQGFKVANDIDIASQGIYIPPERSNKVNITVIKTPINNHSKWMAPHTSYMMALHIAEQLTMSTSHFVEFMNLVHQWNLTGVEPVVYGSRMNGLRSMHAENIPGSVHYHQLLNTSLMREKLSKCLAAGRKDVSQDSNSSQVFVPLGMFLRQSLRTITLVYFSRHMNVLGKHLHSGADSLLSKQGKTDQPVIECADILRKSGISDRVEELLNRELIIEGGAIAENFTVIQAFCIMKVKISLVKIREDILTSIHRNKFNAIDVSIVFISWQGKFTRPFTDMNTLYRCRLPSSQIEPSQQVLATSNQFLKSIGLKKQSYIAIHIRFEKLFETAFKPPRDSRHFLNCCMLKLNVVLKQVKERNNLTSEGSTLLFHDYGPYGTDICKQGGYKSRSVCVNESHYLLSLLNETKASMFVPINFNTSQNSGFVSLVERAALIGGHSLVVLGGGSFQVSITGRFTDKLKREHDKAGAVYSICTARDNLHNLELGEIKECM